MLGVPIGNRETIMISVLLCMTLKFKMIAFSGCYFAILQRWEKRDGIIKHIVWSYLRRPESCTLSNLDIINEEKIYFKDIFTCFLLLRYIPKRQSVHLYNLGRSGIHESRPQISQWPQRPLPVPFEVLSWCPQTSINVMVCLTMCWPWCLWGNWVLFINGLSAP